MQYLTENEILEVIKQRRETDTALQMLIPDWDEYLKLCSKPQDKAFHQSIIFLGIKRGNIDFLLNPFNKILLSREIRKQYLLDLNELIWLREKTEMTRYEKSSFLMGKISEILLAGWFSKNDYKIINMQAWNEKSPDILIEKDATSYCVEVKFIPRYKKSFEDLCNKGVSGYWGGAEQNLKSKIEGASNSLKKYGNKKDKQIAGILISEFMHNYFGITKNCLKNQDDILDYWKEVYQCNSLDEVLVFELNGLEVIPYCRFDIKNKDFEWSKPQE